LIPLLRRTPDGSRVRNIGLIGYTISREDAPWGDPAWELWPCNNLHLFLRPEQEWHRLFDLHDKATVESDPPHVAALKEMSRPVFMWPGAMTPEYPSAVEFPMGTLDRLWRDELNRAGWRYYTNSVSYMVSLAIACLLPGLRRGEGGTIGLWGIDMAVGGDGQAEYSVQRPSCEYWLGVAEGLGLTVFVAERADLLKCAFRYGDTEHSDFAVKIRSRSEELRMRLAGENQRAAELETQLNQNIALRNQLTGALESNEYVRGVWLPPEVRSRALGEDDISMKAPEPVSV